MYMQPAMTSGTETSTETVNREDKLAVGQRMRERRTLGIT